jgi:hypothetical protein
VEPLGRGVRIVHGAENALLRTRAESADDWRSLLPDIPYSPGYGIVER